MDLKFVQYTSSVNKFEIWYSCVRGIRIKIHVSEDEDMKSVQGPIKTII